MKQILALLVAICSLQRAPAIASEFPYVATATVSTPILPDTSGDNAAATRILIEGVVAEVPSRESQRPSWRQHGQKALAPRHGRHPDAVMTGANVLWATNFVSAEGNDVAGCKVSRFCYVATLSEDLYTLMAVLANDSRVQVLSRPRVMTSTGVPANIFIGPTVPYVHGIYSGLERRSSSCFPQFVTVVSLQLTPVASPQGLIVIELRQPIDQLDAGKFPGIDVPAVNSAELQAAQVSVTDRQTFMLGGCCVTPKNRGAHRKTVLRPIDMRGAALLVSSPPKRRRELIALFRASVLPALESKPESVSQPSTLNPQPTVEPPAGAAPARFLYKRNPQAAAWRRKWPASCSSKSEGWSQSPVLPWAQRAYETCLSAGSTAVIQIVNRKSSIANEWSPHPELHRAGFHTKEVHRSKCFGGSEIGVPDRLRSRLRSEATAGMPVISCMRGRHVVWTTPQGQKWSG